MNVDEHLCGYDGVLDIFGFGDWHLVSRTLVEGPNWKVAYDGYLDFYHLPFLHRRSFGPDISNRPIYYAWGPHQRVTSPDPSLLELEDVPEEEWPIERLWWRRVDDLSPRLDRRRLRRRPRQPVVPRPDA